MDDDVEPQATERHSFGSNSKEHDLNASNLMQEPAYVHSSFGDPGEHSCSFGYDSFSSDLAMQWCSDGSDARMMMEHVERIDDSPHLCRENVERIDEVDPRPAWIHLSAIKQANATQRPTCFDMSMESEEAAHEFRRHTFSNFTCTRTTTDASTAAEQGGSKYASEGDAVPEQPFVYHPSFDSFEADKDFLHHSIDLEALQLEVDAAGEAVPLSKSSSGIVPGSSQDIIAKWKREKASRLSETPHPSLQYADMGPTVSQGYPPVAAELHQAAAAAASTTNAPEALPQQRLLNACHQRTGTTPMDVSNRSSYLPPSRIPAEAQPDNLPSGCRTAAAPSEQRQTVVCAALDTTYQGRTHDEVISPLSPYCSEDFRSFDTLPHMFPSRHGTLDSIPPFNVLPSGQCSLDCPSSMALPAHAGQQAPLTLAAELLNVMEQLENSWQHKPLLSAQADVASHRMPMQPGLVSNGGQFNSRVDGLPDGWANNRRQGSASCSEDVIRERQQLDEGVTRLKISELLTTAPTRISEPTRPAQPQEKGKRQSKPDRMGGGKDVKEEPEAIRSACHADWEAQNIKTVMVRNVPVCYTQQMLIQEWPATYDFLYLPVCIERKRNVSFCFINFVSTQAAQEFHNTWHKKRLRHFTSCKLLDIAPAVVQGRDENLDIIRGGKTFRIKNIHLQPAIFEGNDRISLDAYMKSLKSKAVEDQKQQGPSRQRQPHRKNNGDRQAGPASWQAHQGVANAHDATLNQQPPNKPQSDLRTAWSRDMGLVGCNDTQSQQHEAQLMRMAQHNFPPHFPPRLQLNEATGPMRDWPIRREQPHPSFPAQPTKKFCPLTGLPLRETQPAAEPQWKFSPQTGLSISDHRQNRAPQPGHRQNRAPQFCPQTGFPLSDHGHNQEQPPSSSPASGSFATERVPQVCPQTGFPLSAHGHNQGQSPSSFPASGSSATERVPQFCSQTGFPLSDHGHNQGQPPSSFPASGSFATERVPQFCPQTGFPPSDHGHNQGQPPSSSPASGSFATERLLDAELHQHGRFAPMMHWDEQATAAAKSQPAQQNTVPQPRTRQESRLLASVHRQVSQVFPPTTAEYTLSVSSLYRARFSGWVSFHGWQKSQVDAYIRELPRLSSSGDALSMHQALAEDVLGAGQQMQQEASDEYGGIVDKRTDLEVAQDTDLTITSKLPVPGVSGPADDHNAGEDGISATEKAWQIVD